LLPRFEVYAWGAVLSFDHEFVKSVCPLADATLTFYSGTRVASVFMLIRMASPGASGRVG
jgi:hypothetical protein